MRVAINSLASTTPCKLHLWPQVLLHRPVLVVAGRTRRVRGVPTAAVGGGGASLGRFVLDRDSLLLGFEVSVAAPVRDVVDDADAK